MEILCTRRCSSHLGFHTMGGFTCIRLNLSTDYYSLESMMWESVWTHRVIAVAKVVPPSPGSDQNVAPPSPGPDHKVPPPSLVLPGHTSLHVVFQPGREAVTFYRITLITNSSREDTPSKLLQVRRIVTM